MDLSAKYTLANGISSVFVTIQAYMKRLLMLMDSFELHKSGIAENMPSEAVASRAFNLFGGRLNSENQRKVLFDQSCEDTSPLF